MTNATESAQIHQARGPPSRNKTAGVCFDETVFIGFLRASAIPRLNSCNLKEEIKSFWGFTSSSRQIDHETEFIAEVSWVISSAILSPVEMMSRIPRYAIRLDDAPHATRIGNPFNLTMDLDSYKSLIFRFL
jgi:hypothetical protein